MKSGTLTMKTTVHTASGDKITFPEGTDVVVQRGGLLDFEGTPFTGFKTGENEYRIKVGDEIKRVEFPDGIDEGVPFPWLLLEL